MKVADYITMVLEKCGVTDIFGIPGGVVLSLLYAFNENNNIDVHLNFHEQAAAYAACGYAQQSGRMGVAYATRGPGVTNMITPIAEAYFDSIPMLILTAHNSKEYDERIRIYNVQEMDLIPIMNKITKFAARIDRIEDVEEIIKIAIDKANTGRKGPVFLDFSTEILKKDFDFKDVENFKKYRKEQGEYITEGIKDIYSLLEKSNRPIILIGDGIRHTNCYEKIKNISLENKIPILSSRVSMDIFSSFDMYFGYIGSHATRYSNFILAKSDLIIVVGNRMAYDKNSESFGKILDDKKIVRIEVDENEFIREIPDSINLLGRAEDIVESIAKIYTKINKKWDTWFSVCKEIRERLWQTDKDDEPINILIDLLKKVDKEPIIVTDVGNNELWLSRACAFMNRKIQLLHSKSFKTVGSAIGKAIGAYYACRKDVICYTGDQGLQFNIQEIQFIVKNKIPITIVLMNNYSSGLMKTDEIKSGYKYLLHTTFEDGYSSPDFKKVFMAYGIEYICYREGTNLNINDHRPKVIEVQIDKNCYVNQTLPKGNVCYDFFPRLDKELFGYLESI